MKEIAEPNYFYVNRDLLESERWLSESFTRGQAWVDLFGLAQHSPGFFRIRGIKVDIERGQLAYSQLTLAKRWKWSRGKVNRYLVELELHNDITLKTIQQNGQQIKFLTTLITIVKYDKWQGNRTAKQTADGHQTDTKQDIYNNDKNDKNVKKDSDFESFWSAYPRKVAKSFAKKAWDKAKVENLDSVLSTLEKYKLSSQWIKDNGEYIPHPATWLNRKQWEDEISNNTVNPMELYAKECVKKFPQAESNMAQFEFTKKYPTSDLLKVKHIINL